MFVRALGAPRFMSRKRRTVPLKVGGTSTAPPVVNLPPVWGSVSGTEFTIVQGGTLDLNNVARFTDPESHPMTYSLVSGTWPAGVTLDAATGILTATSSATPTVSTNLVVSASDGSFWDIPSLQDERDLYTNLGWTVPSNRDPSSGTCFGFATTASGISQAAIDIHNDTEGDDLWSWQQHYRRGYLSTANAAKVTNWRDAWLAFFRNGSYLADVAADDAGFSYDHLYGTGLVEYGYLTGDTTSLTMAEQFGEIAKIEWSVAHDGVTPFPPTRGLCPHNPGNRSSSRYALLFIYLAEVIGGQWITWRDAMLDCYANTFDWDEAGDSNASSHQIAVGGHYFATRDSILANPNWNNNGTVADYDAGRRFGTTFMMGLCAEVCWRGFLATGRTDLRNKLVKMARYVSYYAHDPGDWTAASLGGPYVSQYFGSQVVSGPYYHRHVTLGPSSQSFAVEAHKDSFIVNTLVWGYKLTGETQFLDKAKLHFRIGTQWESQTAPGSTGYGSGPDAGATSVLRFLDTNCDSDGTQFMYDKSQFRYCYALLENGGNPTVIP